jgi:hypothetical protein
MSKFVGTARIWLNDGPSIDKQIVGADEAEVEWLFHHQTYSDRSTMFPAGKHTIIPVHRILRVELLGISEIKDES